MLVFICLGLLSAVYATDLKYQFVGEFYDPTPLPHSVWHKFKHYESTLFPPVPNRNLPGVRLLSPKVVFPDQSITYASFYNQNKRGFNDGPGTGLGFFGPSGGHGGYNYGGYSGRGGSSYGYDGYSGHHDDSYDARHGSGYGDGYGTGYGSAYNSADSPSRGY